MVRWILLYTHDIKVPNSPSLVAKKVPAMGRVLYLKCIFCKP